MKVNNLKIIKKKRGDKKEITKIIKHFINIFKKIIFNPSLLILPTVGNELCR